MIQCISSLVHPNRIVYDASVIRDLWGANSYFLLYVERPCASRKLILHNVRPLNAHNDGVGHRPLGIVLLSQVLETEPAAVPGYP